MTETEIQLLAKRYIDEIRDVQPEGPYRIGGICTGGIIAYEMAQQLYKQGQEVAVLAMIEPRRPFKPGVGANFNFLIETLIRSMKEIRHHTTKLIQLDSGQKSNYIRLLFKALVNSKALRHYEPKPYPGFIHLFLTDETLSQKNPPRKDWQGLALEGSKLHKFSGKHNTVISFDDKPFDAEHVQALADELLKRQNSSM